MKNLSKALLLLGICFTSLHVRAQYTRYRLEAGLNIGTLLYQGDLVESPFGSFKGARPMVNVWMGKAFTPYFGWRANLSVGSLSADESRFEEPSWKRYRNFAFRTPVTELSGLLVFNPYGDNGKSSYHTLTPYVMAGVGASFLNIRRDWSRLDSNSTLKAAIQDGLTRDSLHALPSVLPVVPVGAGLRWRISPRIALNAEAMMRFSFSDYIDGFSYAANPRRKDGYYGLSLGISFLLGGSGVDCPVVPKE